ncbi:amino acid permease [Streptomyces sp. B8F3]|uniref:amino acid permease n=1 Tax=Streptomyces sp. B8F3 TaxID=3153573 RepID=UPI00325DBC06
MSASPHADGGAAAPAGAVSGAAPADSPADATTPAAVPVPSDLGTGLKQRHLTMIALGGVIGAGLFVGSGAGIAAAGPGIVLAYAVSGLLVMLVMRMLGEMSAAHPASGSFSVHAERALGPWAGLTSGWMYWTLLGVAIAAEAIGASQIVTGWLPGTESWMWVLLFMAVFCVTNLAAVGNFGEAEFWFAGLKVAAITAFLALGLLAVLGLLPGTGSPGTANLTGDGDGFLPNGSEGLLVGLLASVFAYGGLENVTIAAAESEHPRRGVARAVRTAMYRIAIFYVGSMLVVVALIPWDDPAVRSGPYAAALDHLGIPAAGQVMNVVVLVALLSAMNANIYGASRMAYSLVARGQGPRFLGRLTHRVPRRAVVATCSFGFAAVLLSYRWPDTLFQWLLNMVGAAILVVWAFTAAAQLRTRRRLERESPELLTVRMWAYPYLTWAALAAIGGILVLMLREPDSRTQLLTTAGLTVALSVVGLVRQHRRGGTRMT